MQVYTLVGFKADGASSAIDVVAADDHERALDRARQFLAEHHSCALVEVWRGGVLVDSMARAVPAGAEDG